MDVAEIINLTNAGGGRAVDGLRFLALVKEQFSGEVIAAHFDPHGRRLSGSAAITVRTADLTGNDAQWYFYVEPVAGYAFIRFPLIDGAIAETLAKHSGSPNADSRLWRWIPAEVRSPANAQGAHAPDDNNVLVEFIVAGYRPDQLVAALSG